MGALTSVLSCNPLKKKIAHTATYFTVTSGSSGPVCRDRKRRGEGRVEEGERRGGRREEEGWGGVGWSGRRGVVAWRRKMGGMRDARRGGGYEEEWDGYETQWG